MVNIGLREAEALDCKMILHIADRGPHIPNPLGLYKQRQKNRSQPAFAVKRVGPSHFSSIRIVFKPPTTFGKFRNVHVCVESFEICLLALSGGDRLVEVVAGGFPWASAVSQRVPQEVGTSEIGGSAPTPEIDLLNSAGLCLFRPDDRV